jgi:hypothetical protein
VRTDIYDKLGRVLKLPPGKLAGLADLQRKQELRKKIESPPVPLFKEVRQLLLAKCSGGSNISLEQSSKRTPLASLNGLIAAFVIQAIVGYLLLHYG